MHPAPGRTELYAQAAAMTSVPAAIKHLRAYTGCSLVEGKRLAERIADDQPGSALALGRTAWEAKGRRLRWIALALIVGLAAVALVVKRLSV